MKTRANCHSDLASAGEVHPPQTGKSLSSRAPTQQRPFAALRVTALLTLVAAVSLAVTPASREKKSAPAANSKSDLQVVPPSLTFEDARDVRRAIVLAKEADGRWVDVTTEAKFTISDEIIRQETTPLPAWVTTGTPADYNRGVTLVPVKKGSTTIKVEAKGLTTTLPVTVKSMDHPPVSFVREVEPVMSIVGCNAGTCHGAAKGKNGFKLALRGYDPEVDHHALVDDVAGRRFNRADPDQSLMLLKPTAQVPHVGGQVLQKGTREYEALRQWIAEGVQFDGEKMKRATRVEILPNETLFKKEGEMQQTIVLAHFDDGTSRDVTHHAHFTSSVPEVATISRGGLITAVKRGEAVVLVRYEGLYANAPVTMLGDRTGYQWVKTPEYNYIDKLICKKLQQIQALPSETCTDAEFLRRVSLDLTGLPPTTEKARAFLSGKGDSKKRREALIDELLASEEFVDHWTTKWADLLEVNRKWLGEKGIWAYRGWIREQIAANKPYDLFVRALMTSSGDCYDQPAANYFRVAREPKMVTEKATQLFLGTRFQCNQCHDHPFERWTQNQYYEVSAFFAQVGIKRGDRHMENQVRGVDTFYVGDEIIYDKDEGEVKHLRYGNVVAPKFPFALPARQVEAVTAAKTDQTRREEFAAWLVAPENPYFARAMTNRVWSYFFGRGVIDPVDDIRSGNPPSNPELLAALTDDFIKHKFDVKYLMRTICNSRTYQQSIRTNKWNEDDTANFSHQTARRLTAEQLLDAISVATGSTQKFSGLPAGFRAAQLPDTLVQAGGFMDLFGRPPRESPCECERSTQVSLGQTLNLVNGPTINDAITDADGRIARLMKQNPDDIRLIEEIYLATLSRFPTQEEATRAAVHMKSAASRVNGEDAAGAAKAHEEAAQDLMWALLNTPAFLFNY